jgi:prolyl oligopeptidase
MSEHALDPHLWLEDVYSEKALDWVKSKNQNTLLELKDEKIFKQIESEVRTIVQAPDRLPTLVEHGEYFYNFWQDAKNKKGILRRCKISAFAALKTNWELILDIDALSTAENESWVYQGANFLAPDFNRCLIILSRGGKDASIRREFDVSSKTFVKDGFYIPEAKSHCGWIDQDTLFLGTDFGAGSLTHSGYPRTVRILKRGQAIAESRQIYACAESDVVCHAFTILNTKGTFAFLSRRSNFFESQDFYLNLKDNSLTEIPLPLHTELLAFHDSYGIYNLRKDWKQFKSGSLISLEYGETNPEKCRLLWEPTEDSSFLSVIPTQDHLFLLTQEHVSCRLWHIHLKNSNLDADAASSSLNATFSPIEIPEFSMLAPLSYSQFSNTVIFNQQSFLHPPQLMSLKQSNKHWSLESIQSLPSRFDESSVEVSQQFVSSKDGTKVPYFLIHKKNLLANGQNPTLLYAYGGFEISETPAYLSTLGKSWIERGGVYAVANIRGGGEYGPRWHQAALREKRQNAFDDFFAVSEDLIAKKITNPKKLGIQGGSNGGLLMGVAFTQRPELYEAIICQVPLLDMLRFHKLLAGHSWTAEYGNPDDQADRRFIEKYSPYQNIKEHHHYPKIFFITSTADDRVHPAHARKMAARLEVLGKKFFYFENIEGGHAAGADPEQVIFRQSLEFTYLAKQLMD